MAVHVEGTHVQRRAVADAGDHCGHRYRAHRQQRLAEQGVDQRRLAAADPAQQGDFHAIALFAREQALDAAAVFEQAVALHDTGQQVEQVIAAAVR